MKLFLLALLALSGCSSTAFSDNRKPTGEDVFDILLKNAELSLSTEPLCDISSATRKKMHITLGEHLATVLSVSHETANKVTMSSSCDKTKFEDDAGSLIDVWDCKVEVHEANPQGQFISSSMIAFSAELEDHNLVRGSVRCF